MPAAPSPPEPGHTLYFGTAYAGVPWIVSDLKKTYVWDIFYDFLGSGAWVCQLGAWNCLLGAWNCQLGAWNCLLGAWNCLLGAWNCQLGTWNCLLGAWNCLLGAWNCQLGAWNCLLGAWNLQTVDRLGSQCRSHSLPASPYIPRANEIQKWKGKGGHVIPSQPPVEKSSTCISKVKYTCNHMTPNENTVLV